MTAPFIGDRVLYRMTDTDRRRVGDGIDFRIGDNPLPLIVVRARGYTVDGHVLLPTQRPTFYVRSIPKGIVPGTWSVRAHTRSMNAKAAASVAKP